MAAKKKATKVEKPIEDVSGTVVPENTSKIINTPSWKEIQEKYGILTDEILDANSDLSKYGITPEDEDVLRRYVKKVYAEKAEVVFDMIHAPEQVKKIVAFYWVTVKAVEDWELDKLWLTDDEQKVINDYYDELFKASAKLVKIY